MKIKYLIFVERVFDDEIFEALQEFLKKNRCICFLMTPVNFNLIQAEQDYKGTKEELEVLMIERYKIIEKLSADIGLHLHLSLMPEKMSYEDQEKRIEEAMKWMTTNNLKHSSINFGWYKYSDDTLEIVRKKGVMLLEKGKALHDYEIIELKNWKRKLHLEASNLYHSMIK